MVNNFFKICRQKSHFS